MELEICRIFRMTAMHKILRSALPMFAAAWIAFSAATSDAAWPRYRVSAGYSLPSAPAMRPMFVPVYPTDRYLQANPGVVPATYGAPQVSVPGYGGQVAPANMQPSLLAPPAVSVPNTSYYPQTYNAPQYNQPAYNPAYNQPYNAGYNPQPVYNPAPVTAYSNPQPYQPYQQPRPIQPYTGAVQPYGGFYQPTRPSTVYSPTPSYYPQQPVFGQY
jgi:hypothetical protein